MAKITKHLNIISIVTALVSAFVAVVSVYFAYGQLSVAINQQKALTNEQIATTRLEDLRFVGRISVELNESSRLIHVSNYSDLPLTDATLWTLGLTAGSEGDKLDTIRMKLMGLGACRTITFSVDTLVKVAAESADDDMEPPESADEPYITFKAPSGSWYTVSEIAVYPPYNHPDIDSLEAAKYSEPEGTLADTVLEGDISEQRTVDVRWTALGPTQPVTSPFTLGQVELSSNGCAGPGR